MQVLRSLIPALIAPNDAEWSFANLDRRRARELENAPSFGQIVLDVRRAFKRSIADGSARAESGSQGDPRATIQFRVNPVLYDMFFNSRTGYRAQYWRSLRAGNSANALLVGQLLEEL